MAERTPIRIERAEIAQVVNQEITREIVWDTLDRLQDPAPSGTELLTRTPILRQMIVNEAGVPFNQFENRFMGTDSPAVLLPLPQRLIFTAHSDTVSLAPPQTNETTFDLTPLSAHRPSEAHEWPAAVLRFNLKANEYEFVSTGIIGSDASNNMKPYYKADVKPKNGFIPGLDRVVYTPSLKEDPETGLWTGNMDNPAGLTVSVLALKVLARLAREKGVTIEDFGIGFIFPGSEEGLPEASAFFSREARRVFHRMPYNNLPEVVIEVDGHDHPDPRPVVSYAGIVSGGKGAVVPPDLFAKIDDYLQGLKDLGINAQSAEEGKANASRSNDAATMEVMSRVGIVGYDVRDPHFNAGLPTVNPLGLINTAKAVAYMAAELGLQNSFR